MTFKYQLIKQLKSYQILLKRNYSATCNGQKPISYFHNVGQDPLVHRTLGQHLDLAVEKFSDRTALITCQDQQRITFAEINNQVDSLAKGLLAIGLERGDRVGIWSPNTINWYISLVAIAKAGLVSVALNPAYQAPELSYAIDKVQMKGIIAYDVFRTQNYYNILKSALPKIENDECDQSPIIIIDSENKYPGSYKFNEVLRYGKMEKWVPKGPQCDDDCNIQFTSGTTGQPKAAVLTHFNIVNNGISIGYRNELNLKQHRICMPNPFFHVYGMVAGIAASMAYGATIVLPNAGYSPADSLSAIVNEKCTFLYGTPTMYVDLIAQQNKRNLPGCTPEFAFVGGAPCPLKLYQDMKNVLNIKVVKNIFGMTETTAAAFTSIPNENSELTTNSVGILQDHLEAKVVDENGEVTPMGTPGELLIRGYSTMSRYCDDDQKTKEILSNDKWLRTGDQFVLFKNGYGQIIGRLKDIIIRGGENISPKEIEAFLVTHPDIIDAQVFGVPDNRMGEELCAYIRTVESRKISQEDLKTYSKGKIASFKIPRYVVVVDSFPTTLSGKIQKYKLKEHFLQQNS